MNKVLIPVDGSSNALLALKHAVNVYGKDAHTEIHICNVQPKLYFHIGKSFSKKDVYEWQAERAKRAAQSAVFITKS